MHSVTLNGDEQVDLAMKLLPQPAQQVRRLGSVMVCEGKDVEEMKSECNSLQELGCECRWMCMDELQALPGAAVGFDAGILFPYDAIIDSTAYAQARSTISMQRALPGLAVTSDSSKKCERGGGGISACGRAMTGSVLCDAAEERADTF